MDIAFDPALTPASAIPLQTRSPHPQSNILQLHLHTGESPVGSDQTPTNNMKASGSSLDPQAVELLHASAHRGMEYSRPV